MSILENFAHLRAIWKNDPQSSNKSRSSPPHTNLLGVIIRYPTFLQHTKEKVSLLIPTMNCTITEEELVSPYLILFKSLCLIPFFHYLFFLFLAILLFLYLFLEIHFPRSDPISLTFNPNSDLCQFIVSKCRLLHGR